MTIQIKEVGAKENIWIENVSRVEKNEGILTVFKGTKFDEYCIYRSWVDKLVYYAVL